MPNCPCFCVSSAIKVLRPGQCFLLFLYLYDNFSPAMVINTDPSAQQRTIVVVCIVAPIISSLFAAIRIWTRIFITHSIGRDDCKLPRLSLSRPHPHTIQMLLWLLW